ncbi:GWxTD domain-containing protein [candidate division KSB1 bacterium]
MTRKLFFIALFLIYSTAYANQNTSSEIDSISVDLSDNKYANEFYHRGVNDYREGEFEAAVESFKRAVEIDDNFAEAYDQLALTYIEIPSVHSRTLAERALIRAIQINPKNVVYKLHFGKLLLRQGFRWNARKRFEYLKKVAPESTELYMNLGLLYKSEMEYFKNMVSIDSEDSGILNFINSDMLGYIFDYQGSDEVKEVLAERNESIGKYTDFTEYVMKDYANAVIAFTEVLNIDSTNKDALHNLSLLALDANMTDEFIDYQKKIIANYPEDKDAHLFLGYGYHKKRDDETAYDKYLTAKSLMENDEKAAFESIDYIVPHDKLKEYAALSPDERNGYKDIFWRQRDPLYLSEYNERTLEHYTRVAYANLYFGVKAKDKSGWKTDRGKIYIRYGPPNRIVRMRPEKGGFGGRDYDLTEIWYYDGFSFAFEDRYLTGDFTLGSRSRFPNVHYPEIAEDIYTKKPEIYQPEFPGKIFHFAYSAVSFRGENGKSNVEIYYALPVKDLEPKLDDKYKTAQITQGIFLSADDWKNIQKSIKQEKIIISPNLNLDNNYYIIGKNTIEADPGDYNLSVEVQETNTKNTGSYRQNLTVDSYEFGELKTSDILIASTIDNSNKNPDYIKNNLRIIPNPAKIFQKSQLLNIYFELYNLTVSPGQKTNFTVEYKISAKSSSEKPLVTRIASNIGKLIGTKEGKNDITASYEYEGTLPTEKINLSIDMSSAKSGVYTLTITSTDLYNNKKVSKNVQIGIQSAAINYLF